MRLLRSKPDGHYSLISVTGSSIPKYAILSHTWERDDEELTIKDIQKRTATGKAGYRKLQFCAKQAGLDGIQYFWVDSCCIDRSSSAELTEAINSMFRWYRNAEKCYVFLSDVKDAEYDEDAFCRSRWFTRGWTLQELLAPQIVVFFNQNGRALGDKLSLERGICRATGIPLQALQHHQSLAQFSREERMSWIKNRETSIEEDKAYCLLGIFDVHLPLIYGEGEENAFRRLQLETSARHARDGPRSVDASASDKKDACLASLFATDQTRFLSQVLHHSRDACSWIFQNPEFARYVGSDESTLLWITARPGCGKTTIAAHVWKSIMAREASRSSGAPREPPRTVALSFFFQRSNNEAVTTAAAALSTIIRQLVDQAPASLPVLLKRHELLSAKGDFEWSWDNLSSVLGDMIQTARLSCDVYVILDALDECEPQSRGLIVEYLKGFMDQASLPLTRRMAMLRVLVTSRPDGDLFEQLAGYSHLDITKSDTAADIQTLIHNRVHNFAVQRNLKDDVISSIVRFLEDNAHGMFLWVELIMKELEKRDKRLSDEVLASKLTSTPVTLIDTYGSILDAVPPSRKDDMWRIYRWLLYGRRSLTLAELETALCTETGTSSWHDFIGDLTFLCGSLLHFAGALDEVSFVHQTARAFLSTYAESSHMRETVEVNFGPQTANESLATACLAYMLRDDLFVELDEAVSDIVTFPAWMRTVRQFIDQRPFLQYAIDSWAFHLRSTRQPSPRISEMTRTLLSKQRRRDGIMTLTYFLNKASWGIPAGQAPIHIAAYFNIPWLAKMYIAYDDGCINHTTGMSDTPLIWAAEMGSVEVVKILLEAGADANSFEIDGWSALHWAARNGHASIATMLLERGASVTQRDRDGHKPLDWAIDRQHLEVISILRKWSQDHSLGDSDEWESGPVRPTALGDRGVTSNSLIWQGGSVVSGSQGTWRLWDNRP